MRSLHFHRIGLINSLAWISLIIQGCTPSLETKYAVSRGVSINGIVSFIDLLRNSGRKVDVWPGVSPQMGQSYDTLIVFQNNYDQLPEKLNKGIRNLMFAGTVRRLIIVVRDSDAAIEYWRQIRDRSESSPQETADAGRSYDQMISLFNSLAGSEFDAAAGTWYGLKKVDRSDDQFTKSIECQSERGSFSVTARWPLHRRLAIRESAEVLWKSGDDPLLTIEKTTYGEVMVLASATPILNGGLVESGNRRLAAEFVRHIPDGDQVAVAVSSNWIDESDLKSPSLLQFLKVHPNGWVFGQGIAALLMFCWWKFPILGRPRRSFNAETARFGKHVEALGNLLRRTRDTQYAQQRIRDWHGSHKPHSDIDSKLN